MIVTRKIGRLVRGDATPFQIMAAAILASLLGFVPGFSQAPGLLVTLVAVLVVLNANLFVAGLVGLAAKLVALLAAPVVFEIGRLLLTGPLEGLFRTLVNAPVLAWFGLEYFLVSGGLLVGLGFGVLSGLLIVRLMHGLWRKLGALERESAAFAEWTSKGWVKTAAFLFAGGVKGKKGWDELLARRVGNPVRIAGVVLVLVVGGLVYAAAGFLRGPVLTAWVRGALERANGATVDLEGASFDLASGKLELVGLAMADPGELTRDLFAARRIEAAVGTGDLLRKRAVVDTLLIQGATNGTERAAPGVLVGPPPEGDGLRLELPDMESLGDVLENAPVWRERLATARRWLERLSGGPAETPAGPTLEEQLRARVRALGYAGVRHDPLIDRAPTLLVRRLEAREVVSGAMPGRTLDIRAENLSTQPRLVAEPAALDVVSSTGDLKARVALPSGVEPAARLQFVMTGLAVDEMVKQLKRDGPPPVSGGTLEISADGTLSGVDSDLPLLLTLRDTTLSVGGGRSAALRELKVPVAVRGPIDNPLVRVDGRALQDALVSVGRDELTRRLGDQLQRRVGGEPPAGGEPKRDDAVRDAAGGLLDGLLKKREER